MNKTKLLIADMDDCFTEMITHFLSRYPDIEIQGVERSGHDALRRVRLDSPDVVVFDLLLPDLDGLALLNAVRNLAISPAMICCTQFYSPAALEALRQYGASYMIFKPVDPQSLYSAVVRFSRIHLEMRRKMRSMLAPGASDEQQDMRIRNQLVALGIPTRLVGCNYLTEGVRLAISDTSLTRNLSKGLYLEISRAMDTTPVRVERCIRNAISAAYNTGSLQQQMPSCPSNKEFINFVLRMLDIPNQDKSI